MVGKKKRVPSEWSGRKKGCQVSGRRFRTRFKLILGQRGSVSNTSGAVILNILAEWYGAFAIFERRYLLLIGNAK